MTDWEGRGPYIGQPLCLKVDLMPQGAIYAPERFWELMETSLRLSPHGCLAFLPAFFPLFLLQTVL